MPVNHQRLRLRIALLSMLIAISMAIALTGPTSVLAADPSIEVLQVGWDGLMVPGSWSPVKVRVTGGSSDLSGEIEVVTKARYQTGPQSAGIDFPTGAFGQEIALPAGVAKETTLWVPSDPNYGGPASPSGSVRLLVSGRVASEERIEFRTTKTPMWPVIGVLADSPVVARAIAQVELAVQGLPVPLSPARLSASDIPTSAERLGALSALVVQGNAAANLTGEQRQAILAWATAGGHIVLAGGPDASRTASVLPAGTLELTFSGADSASDLYPLANWASPKLTIPSSGPVARFRANSGVLLAGSTDIPLAWRMGIGQGTVTVLAADPGLEPLASWTGTPALLQKALEPALPSLADVNDKILYVQQMQRDLASRLRGVVDALPPEAFPGWQTVALILGGFLILVGPLLHFVLSRADRRTWAWLAVPALALLLTGGMFYLGIGREGRDVLLNVVGHVQLDPAGGGGRQTLIAGFFAPTHSDLTVKVPGDAAVRPFTVASFQPYYGGPGNGDPALLSKDPPYRVVTGRDTRIDFGSGQWGMRSFSMSRTVEGTGSILANLVLDEGLVKGSVRNDTPFPMEDAAVMMGQGVAKLGSLAPGQTVQVVLDPGSPVSPFGGQMFPLTWRVLGSPVASGASSPAPAAAAYAVSSVAISSRMPVPAMYSGAPERYQVSQDPETQRRLRLLDSIVNVPKMGPGAPTMPLTFLAFTRVPVGKDLPNAEGHPAFHLTLLNQALQLNLPTGPFTIPPAMSPAEIVTQSGGMGGGSNGTVSWVQIQNGSVTLSYRPPLPTRAKVDALILTTQQMGQSSASSPGKGMAPPSPNAQPTPAEQGVFSIFNWHNAAWEPLPGGNERTRVEPATPYVGPGGEVRVQVTAAADKSIMFIQPELTVEGRMEE